jgi:hypothetical protein
MNMLTIDEQYKEITMNPKVQAIFLHMQLLMPFSNTSYMWKQKTFIWRQQYWCALSHKSLLWMLWN